MNAITDFLSLNQKIFLLLSVRCFSFLSVACVVCCFVIVSTV